MEILSSRLRDTSSRHRGVTPASLAAVVDGLARSVDPSGLDVSRHNGRDYRSLLRTDLLDAWLIAWGPSSFLDLHDHGGSSGAFAVIAGSLIEVATDLAESSPLTTTILGVGTRRTFGPLHVHEVWNPNAHVAVSVHVYSPPLTEMSFYAGSAPSSLARLRTERTARDVPPDL